MKKIFPLLLTMSRLLFVLLLVIGAFVFAMFQGGIVSWTIFYAILPFAIYSLLLFFYSLSSFSVERHVKKSGDSIKVDITLTRKMPFPLLYTTIHDEWKGGQSVAHMKKSQALFLVGWKKKVSWTYEVLHLPRGEYVASDITIKVMDFFGWMKKSKTIPMHSTVLIYPKIGNIHYVSLGSEKASGSALSPLYLLKDTNVVTSVRDYEEGDRMSWIHWKSFARTEMLMTKEFDDRGSEDLQLVFDNRLTPHFEAQVTFAASILQVIQKEGLSIQFLPIHQEEVIDEPLLGEAQFRMSLHYLAKVQPTNQGEVIPTISFRRALNRYGILIVVTSKLDIHLRHVIERYVGGHRTVVCFVVVENDAALTRSMKEEVNAAKIKGIQVQVVSGHQFTDSFKEVMKK